MDWLLHIDGSYEILYYNESISIKIVLILHAAQGLMCFTFTLANSADNHFVTFNLVKSNIAYLVECLTCDQEVIGLSPTEALCCVLKTFYQHCLVLVQSKKMSQHNIKNVDW